MLVNRKLISHIFLFAFLISFFTFNYIKFQDLPPRIDQSFHLYWLQQIIKSDLNFLNNLNEIFSIFTNKNTTIYEVIRVMAVPTNYFSYYFHFFFIILLTIIYFITHFLFEDLISFFNFFSIFFATLNILLSYKIFRFLISEIKLPQRNILYNLIFISVFCSYYLFYFSPLGIHNFSSFFFLLTIFFYLKKLKNMTSYSIFIIGILSAISILFHLSNLLLLVPALTFYTLILDKNIKFKFKLVFFYLLPLIVVLFPFFLLIIFDNNKEYTSDNNEWNLFLNFFNYFKNWIYLIGPMSILVFYNLSQYEKVNNKSILFAIKSNLLFVIVQRTYVFH